MVARSAWRVWAKEALEHKDSGSRYTFTQYRNKRGIESQTYGKLNAVWDRREVEEGEKKRGEEV